VSPPRSATRYALYLLYWYKSACFTRGAALARGGARACCGLLFATRLSVLQKGARRYTHFTCFTGTKVPILTPEERDEAEEVVGRHAVVQVYELTHVAALPKPTTYACIFGGGSAAIYLN
jgi:hypothetical protein